MSIFWRYLRFESAPDKVGNQEFLTFSDRLLAKQAAIFSLSWIPRVRGEDRTTHERAAQQEGLAGYRIRSVSEDGALIQSAVADEYFPVYYTTERVRAESVYGLNLADNGTRQQALETARDNNMLAASQNLILQSGTGARFGFFVVLPIYRRGLPHSTVEDRRRNLVGFGQGVFQIDAMIAETLRGLTAWRSGSLHQFTQTFGNAA